MADEIQKLYDLPDVSFIDDITFDQILNENITNWQNELYEKLCEDENYGIKIEHRDIEKDAKRK